MPPYGQEGPCFSAEPNKTRGQETSPMNANETDKPEEPLDDLPDVKTPEIKAPAGSLQAALELSKAQIQAYEDSILTLTAKRNHINASIRHRRAQLQAAEDLYRKLVKMAGPAAEK